MSKKQQRSPNVVASKVVTKATAECDAAAAIVAAKRSAAKLDSLRAAEIVKHLVAVSNALPADHPLIAVIKRMIERVDREAKQVEKESVAAAKKAEA